MNIFHKESKSKKKFFWGGGGVKLVRDITCTFMHCYAPTLKKLKGQITG